MTERPDLAAGLAEALAPLVAELVDRELARRRAELEPPVWLTLEEAADVYLLGADALRKRAQRGSLPGAVKDESRWLVDRRVLDRALADGIGSDLSEKEGRAPRQRPRPGTRK